MCALAQVFESAGITTVALAAVWGFVSRMRPPRALYCEFPLGRPLGRPADPTFQQRVLDAAFALLDAPAGPVLETFPEAIDADGAEPLACALPPRFDPDLHPAVDEARSLAGAWRRGLARGGEAYERDRAAPAEAVPDALDAFAKVAAGAPWRDTLPANPLALAHDIRAYYETAALALADHTPAAWAATRWFLDTEAGRLLAAARDELRAQDAPFWMLLLPR